MEIEVISAESYPRGYKGPARLAGSRARIRKPFQEPRNRFQAWRTGTTTLFDVPGHQAKKAGEIDSLGSIPGSLNVYKYRLRLIIQ